MKSSETLGPSKNASQDWSAGVMRRLRPTLVISTCRTLGGKATGFGKRTAWLRFVVKTVDRVILRCLPQYILAGYTKPLHPVKRDFHYADRSGADLARTRRA